MCVWLLELNRIIAFVGGTAEMILLCLNRKPGWNEQAFSETILVPVCRLLPTRAYACQQSLVTCQSLQKDRFSPERSGIANRISVLCTPRLSSGYGGIAARVPCRADTLSRAASSVCWNACCVDKFSGRSSPSSQFLQSVFPRLVSAEFVEHVSIAN